MTYIRRTMLFLAGIALVVAGASCSKNKKKKETPTSSDQKEKQQKETPETREGKTVVLYEYRFNPNTLTISKGTQVTFKNKDQETHRVKIAALDVDEDVEPGEDWSHTFQTTGEFAIENPDAERQMKMTMEVREEIPKQESGEKGGNPDAEKPMKDREEKSGEKEEGGKN